MSNFFFAILFCLSSYVGVANPIGQTASYQLSDDGDRTSWMIQDGQGLGTVVEFRNDPRIGPAYVVSIEYSLDVVFRGTKQGTIGLLVPATMFEDQFYQSLKLTHPVNVGPFHVDYLGMSQATDNEENTYDQCMVIKFFNLNPVYRPIINNSNIEVLWHESEGTLGNIDDVVLTFKRHSTIPVLGAVEFDMSGTVKGVSLKAGFNFQPN
jgi:hypothetical protein